MVVAPHSLSKHCTLCGHSESTGVICCSKCKRLQPFPEETPSYFDIFGYSPQLELNFDELREKFYLLSQRTHPDVQNQQDTLDQINAGRWSSLINKAYQTLRDPFLRTEYLLELFPLNHPSSKILPTELAEAYFELQETLMDSPNTDALKAFHQRLNEEESKLKSEWVQLNQNWLKLGPTSELMKQLRAHQDNLKYLLSLRKDLNKWGAP